MKINSTLNGGVRYYVSILPALFPAIVFVMIGVSPQPKTISTPKMGTAPLVERVREIYTSQIGVRERPSNSGPQVEKYLKYVGLSKGNPWCAAFVCWVLGEAGVENPRTGWSPALFGSRHIIWDREQGTKNKEQRFPPTVPTFGITVSNSIWKSSRCACPPPAGVGGGMLHHRNLNPTTGDIFGLYFSEKGRIAHVGFVDDWKDGWVTTVEGNTNIAGSREGDGVYRKRRLVRSVYQVARYGEAKQSSIKGK